MFVWINGTQIEVSTPDYREVPGSSPTQNYNFSIMIKLPFNELNQLAIWSEAASDSILKQWRIYTLYKCSICRGGGGLSPPLWCLSTPKFVLTPLPENIVKISHKYIADPPLFSPQIE